MATFIKKEISMEGLNLHKNTEQTILLFRNLDKEQKYNFFKQIEDEIENFYQEFDLSDEQKKELDRRTEEIDNGNVQTIAWETVQEELKQKYAL